MGAFLVSLQHSAIVDYISMSNPLFGTVTAMHYFSLFFLTGTCVIFDMYLFGWVAKGKKPNQFAQEIFPWIWTALAFVLFSGFILWLTDADDYLKSPVMNIKLILVVVTIIWTMLIRRGARIWDESPEIPGAAKFMAFMSIALWMACIMEGNNIAALCGLG